jgi:flavodoxin
MLSSLHIIHASTSGNTEYVVDTLAHFIALQAPDIVVERQQAELAHPKDLLRGDVLILGSGTWNTGGNEGQLNMHMHALLHDRAKQMDLRGKPITFISLGDDRYYFRTRCTEHFLRFQREHNGTLFIPPLVLVNEPYGQEKRIHHWAEKLMNHMVHGKPAHIRQHALPLSPSIT